LIDANKIDKIIQFALLIASEEDDSRDQELGPIHLIKYVYLADLAFARKNNGQTFTGAEWKFFKFGPWAPAVFDRIEPALLAISAEKKTFLSDLPDREDWVRWQATDAHYQSALKNTLPDIITIAISRDVHRFGNATFDLLKYVYNTEPMRNAAPNEFLDFTNLRSQIPRQRYSENQPDSLSPKQRKKLKQKMDALRLKIKERQAEKRSRRLVPSLITSRYDSVYFEGLEWLNSLAGEKIPEGDMDATFSDTIWKSQARAGDDFSG
jgi:hypothetical protein